jgi:thiamine pyrophosphokinase
VKKRALVLGGGSVDVSWALEFLKDREYTMVICADGGLVHADQLGIRPDVLLGDFDSAPEAVLAKYSNVERIGFPPEKDYTDMHLALEEAVKRGAECIDCVGATGTRLDHTLVNIDLLSAGEKTGVPITIYDAHNRIRFCSSRLSICKEEQYGKYVSILPFSETAEVSLSGMKYPLTHKSIRRGRSLTVSNEIAGEEGVIEVFSGAVLVFETRD